MRHRRRRLHDTSSAKKKTTGRDGAKGTKQHKEDKLRRMLSRDKRQDTPQLLDSSSFEQDLSPQEVHALEGEIEALSFTSEYDSFNLTSYIADNVLDEEPERMATFSIQQQEDGKFQSSTTEDKGNGGYEEEEQDDQHRQLAVVAGSNRGFSYICMFSNGSCGCSMCRTRSYYDRHCCWP